MTVNHWVGGSSPSRGVFFFFSKFFNSFRLADSFCKIDAMPDSAFRSLLFLQKPLCKIQKGPNIMGLKVFCVANYDFLSSSGAFSVVSVLGLSAGFASGAGVASAGLASASVVASGASADVVPWLSFAI